MLLNFNLTRRNLVIVCAILIGCILYTFLYLLWQWHNDWLLTHRFTTTPHVIEINQSASLIAVIPKQHLFGKPFSNVPISNLQFRVTGIVKTDNESSKAYISISAQPSKIYRIGDSLSDDIKLYAITSDAIFLENDGHLEKLPLQREKLQFKSRE